MDKNEVSDIISAAEEYVKKLQTLDNRIKRAEKQIVVSGIESQCNIESFFDKMKQTVIEALDARKLQLINNIKKVQSDGIKPLRECKDVILDNIKKTNNLIEQGHNILKTTPSLHDSNNKNFYMQSTILGNLPAVPSLEEVPFIHFTCSDSFQKDITNICNNIGILFYQAPVKDMNLSSLLGQPSNWSCRRSEVSEIDISPSDPDYLNVKRKLKCCSLRNLTRITRIENRYIYHRYMLHKLEYESLGIPFNELTLFHATDQANIPSIITDNLDWRMAKRGKFGQGVIFFPCAEDANLQCSRLNGRNRAMVVCKVLIGKKNPGSCFSKVPPKGYDTTYRNGTNVFVKYYDDEFYPAFVAYYQL